MPRVSPQKLCVLPSAVAAACWAEFRRSGHKCKSAGHDAVEAMGSPMGIKPVIAYNVGFTRNRGVKVRREQILMIWIVGFVPEIALYVGGPDQFIDVVWDLFDNIDAALRDLAARLGAQTY